MRGVGQKTPCPDAICAGRPKTFWPPPNSTLIDGLSFCTHGVGSIAPLVSCTQNGQILLANLLQRSRSTFSWGSFLAFLPSKKASWTPKFRHLGVGQQYPGVNRAPEWKDDFDNARQERKLEA